MNPIDALFQRLRAQDRRAFMPFLTAGDPSLEMTTRLLREVTARGASLVEIGFPYSDPIADGPVIQASYTRALAKGLRVADIFNWARQLAQSQISTTTLPLVGMVSYSIVHQVGPERFLDRAKASGFSGVIVPDLPVEEAGLLGQQAARRDFKLILLVTPATPRDRAVEIAHASTGFLYFVSVTGITGARDYLPERLHDQLAWLRQQTKLPICVGFGISKPEHARLLRDVADGIIVGSAIVRHLEQADSLPADEVVKAVGALTASLVKALDQS